LEDGGGGVGIEDVDALDATACGFDFFAANDLVAGPVATFDKDIWKKCGDDRARSRFVEDEDRVDAFEAGEDFGALVLRDHGSARALEGANAAVAVDATMRKSPRARADSRLRICPDEEDRSSRW
jgi:hypothetical protein